jgi:16S rRNA (guanine527-N7)-methyltransferase
MDSMQKRVRFIEDAAERLGLGNVVPLCGRAEDIGQDRQHREAYDVCVARAVAELPTLAELCLPLVRQGGIWMPAKGACIEVCSAAD